MRLHLLAATLIAAATPVLAHHGWSTYSDQETSVSGTVVSADFGAPHGVIKVRTPQGLWDVMLAPPGAIQRSGLTLEAIPAGTRVTARGHRRTDGASEIKTERLVVGGRTYELYPGRD